MEVEKIAENTNGKQGWEITVTKDFNGTYWDEDFGRYDNILERHIAGWKGYENLPITADPLLVAEN